MRSVGHMRSWLEPHIWKSEGTELTWWCKERVSMVKFRAPHPEPRHLSFSKGLGWEARKGKWEREARKEGEKKILLWMMKRRAELMSVKGLARCWHIRRRQKTPSTNPNSCLVLKDWLDSGCEHTNYCQISLFNFNIIIEKYEGIYNTIWKN